MSPDQIQIAFQVLDHVLGAFVKAIKQDSEYPREMVKQYNKYKREYGNPDPEKSFVIGVCLLAAGSFYTAREAFQDALDGYRSNSYPTPDPVTTCYEYLVWTYASHLRDFPTDAVNNIPYARLEEAIAHFQDVLKEIANKKEQLEKTTEMTDLEIEYELEKIEGERRSTSYLYAMANEAAVWWMRNNEIPEPGRTDRTTRRGCYRKAKEFYNKAGLIPNSFKELRAKEGKDD